MRLILIALLGALATQGCVSMSSLQTAETIEKGKHQWTVGTGTYSSKQKLDATTTVDISGAPYFESTYREGLGENLDYGLKVTIIGSYGADVKYRLVKGENFQFSVGGALGYSDFSRDYGSGNVKNTYIDVMVPLYLSYRFAPRFAVYANPRFDYRAAHYSGVVEANANQNFAGGAAGVKIGHDWGLYAEAAYMKDLGRSDLNVMQYNASIFWESPGGLF